jgi:hypothetical protein
MSMAESPLCEHVEGDGPIVFKHACCMGLEGTVSRWKGSHCSKARTPLRGQYDGKPKRIGADKPELCRATPPAYGQEQSGN